MSLSIKGLDKVELLEALWDNQKPADIFNNTSSHTFNKRAAKRAVDRGWVDYFLGRNIKMDFHGNTINPVFYDRHSFITAKDVISNLTKKKNNQ